MNILQFWRSLNLWVSALGVGVEMILSTNISKKEFALFWESTSAMTGFRLSAAEETSVRHHAQTLSGADPAHYPINNGKASSKGLAGGARKLPLASA
jgi:hypothetical protein